MNYFELHIGDYDQATAHLSACEDGIYMRLIRWYMASEAPLPADIKQVQRRVRAHSKEERTAVQTVLAEFFVLTPDGYRQHRCDEEISQFKDSEPDRNAKRENDRERQRRARDRRRSLFEQLRGHGIVPAFDSKTSDLEAMLSRVTSRDASRDVTPLVTRDNTATHSPLPTTQEPRASIAAAPPPPARAREGDPPDPEPDPGQQPTPRGAACIAIRRAGIAAVNPSHPDLQRLLDAGVTPQDLADTAAELVGKGKGSFPLLLATVDGRLRDASAAGAAPSASVLRKPASTSATPSAEETRALLDSAVQTAEEKAAAAEARRRVMSAFRGKVGHA